jgi:hypothetical protein
MRIEEECKQLVGRFAFYIDHRRYDALLDLFTNDGEFSRPDMSVRGREAMASWLASRPTDTITRHLCGPTVFEDADGERARAVTYAVVYQCQNNGKAFSSMELPVALVEYHDAFHKTAGGWRIAQRAVQPVMVRQPA